MAGSESFDRSLSTLRDRPMVTLFVAIGLVLFLDLLRQLLTGGVVIADVVSFLKNGLVLGMSVGLAGIGLSMTYSILNFANFAHGDLITAGAFAGWITTFVIAGFGEFPLEALVHVGGPIPVNTGTLGVSVTNTPLGVVLGLVIATVVAGGLALLIDRITFKPMRDQSGIALLIASVGVALALRHVIVFSLQAASRGVTAGAKTPSVNLAIGSGSVSVNAHEVTLVVVAGALMVGAHLILRYTKLGTAMRAMADNKDLARVTGIPTERIVTATWLLGGGLTGASGYLIALERGVLTTTLGWSLLLLIFAAVILGGIGSMYGAIAGGLVIGIASRISLVWIPESFILVAAFLVMIAMLLVRPAGLLGGVTTV